MVDVRGLSCPMPVVMVQNALKDEPEKLEVLSDHSTAVQNIERFAASKNYSVSVETTEDGEYRMALTK